MKAIIIEEERFVDLLDSLKLESFKVSEHHMEGIPPDRIPWVVKEIHRAFHYRVTVWAQSHGASCVR
jgi:hypothetical protein